MFFFVKQSFRVFGDILQGITKGRGFISKLSYFQRNYIVIYSIYFLSVYQETPTKELETEKAENKKRIRNLEGA